MGQYKTLPMKNQVVKCSNCNQLKPIVNKTHHLCSVCNRKRLDSQGSKKSKYSKIKKTSETRTKNLALYESVKAKKKKDQIENNYYKCFFCNRPLDNDLDIIDTHHALGRVGKLLTDYRNIFFAHRQHHTDYHSMSVKQLFSQYWYKDFLLRLKRVNKNVYNQELRKLQKAGVIDMEMYINEYK